jgi:hypothetical protein
VTESWSYGGAPHTSSVAGTVTLVEGVTFCISDRSGDIRPGAEQGLFFHDTRFVSRFELRVDGQPLEKLADHCPSPYTATFITRRPPRPGTADSTMLVVRCRYVGNGMREDITVRNLGREPSGVGLVLVVESDFAGLFEVKEGRVQSHDRIEQSADGASLQSNVQQGRESRGVKVSGDGGAVAVPGQLSWQLVVSPREEATISVQVVPVLDGIDTPPRYGPGQPVESSQPATRLAAWRQTATAVNTPDERLSTLLATSAEDLGVLRIFNPEHPDQVVVAAGSPGS